MITVDEFMTPDPYTLSERDTLDDARKVMTDRHIRHIPIIDDDRRLLGIVSQRDVLAASHPDASRGQGDGEIPLGDIMIRDVSSVSETDSVRQAAMFLQSHKYGCLPVVSDEQLIGIITDSDFIAIAINLLEQMELMEEASAMEADDDMSDVDMPEIEEDI